MANLIFVTASSCARIKEGKEKEVQMLIDKYNFQTKEGCSPNLYCRINRGNIKIWGSEYPEWTLVPKNPEDHDGLTNHFLVFLERLAPFLAEDLIIHSIGNEKFLFPFFAMEIKVTPDGVVYGGEFQWVY